MTESISSEELAKLLARVPVGTTRCTVDGVRWAISRVDRAQGRTTTFSAEELGGAGYVSANIWRTSDGLLLRPCEMPAARVIEFLRQLPPK